MFAQGCDGAVSHLGFRDNILGKTRASKLRGETATIIKRSLIKFSGSAGQNRFSFNLSELNGCGNKLGVVQPPLFFYLVGRLRLNVFCDRLT